MTITNIAVIAVKEKKIGSDETNIQNNQRLSLHDWCCFVRG